MRMNPRYEKPDPKAKSMWRINYIITFLIYIVIIVPTLLVFSLAGVTKYTMIIYIPMVVVGVLLLLWRLIAVIVYPIIKYRQWGYIIGEDRIEIQHGIFFITEHIIPIVRIQHIDVHQGPLNRMFGLYSVSISLASGKMEILGLDHHRAMAISENLKNRMYTRLNSQDEQIRRSMEVKR